jgi:hypothetical protein
MAMNGGSSALSDATYEDSDISEQSNSGSAACGRRSPPPAAGDTRGRCRRAGRCRRRARGCGRSPSTKA